MARILEQGDPEPGEASERIREKALALGFDAIGIAPPELGPGTGRDLLDYVAAGIHGDMGWLEATAERRADPQILWPQVKSVIVLAANYGPPGDPLAILDRTYRNSLFWQHLTDSPLLATGSNHLLLAITVCSSPVCYIFGMSNLLPGCEK